MKFQVEISEKADSDLRNIFLILYTPCLEEKIVHIMRIMYSGRDISEQLNQ